MLSLSANLSPQDVGVETWVRETIEHWASGLGSSRVMLWVVRSNLHRQWSFNAAIPADLTP